MFDLFPSPHHRRLVGALLVIGVTLAASLRSRLLLVSVSGDSMTPTYSSGDLLLAARMPSWGIRTGMVVVLRPPKLLAHLLARPNDPIPERLIKRVRSSIRRGDRRGNITARHLPLPPTTYYFVTGDALTSIDSRHFGPIPASSVEGVVLCRLRKSPSV